MEGVIGKGADVLFNYGVLGVALVAACFVVWRLWSALQHSQESRLSDSAKIHTALESNTNALENLTKVIEFNLPQTRRRNR